MVKVLSLTELQTMLKEGHAQLIDVRDPHEFEQGHIPSARNLPLSKLQADASSLPEGDSLVFVCARGQRSMKAAHIAESAGKSISYSLEGGTQAWAHAGLPLDTDSRAQTLEVRASQLVHTGEIDDEASTEESALQPELDALVAANLKQFRAQLGLSLDDLAREAQVSRTVLGQIEMGRTPASIGVVWRIAQAMGLPFSALLSTATTVGTLVTQRASAKRLLSADGRFSSRALFPLGDASVPEFYELWLAPHSREDAQAHRPGTRENLIVTAGHLQLVIGSQTHELGPGDAVFFQADVPHSYVNLRSEECWMHLVMSYANGRGARLGALQAP